MLCDTEIQIMCRVAALEGGGTSERNQMLLAMSVVLGTAPVQAWGSPWGMSQVRRFTRKARVRLSCSPRFRAIAGIRVRRRLRR